MKISVCHVITTIDSGGAETQLLALASAQKKANMSVEVIFLKDLPTLRNRFIDSGIQILNQYSGLNFIRQILKLAKRRSDTNTVFHAHLPRAEILCAIALKRNSFVITRHNAERFFPRAPAIVSQLLSKFVQRRAFTTILISQAVKDYVIDNGELSKRLTNRIIYYGVSATLYKLPTKMSFSPSKKVRLGCISRLVPQKNLPLLLQAARNLTDMNDFDFSLKVLGNGPLEASLNKLCKTLEIQEFVSFDGKLEDVSLFYNELDLFVLTSNYEGFGLVLLEAMQFGVPIVARNISAIPEVLGLEHPGLINSGDPQEFASVIHSLIVDSRLRQSCLEHQKKQLSKFSLDKTVRAHTEVYRDLIQFSKTILK